MADKNKTVQVTLTGAEGVVYDKAPLTFGVPFAEGELPADKTVLVIDDDGSPAPAQTSCLTTWHSDGRDIKWLLVDTQQSADGEA